MKRFLLSLVVIVLFIVNASAQKQFAGIIKSKTDIEGENVDVSIKAQYPIIAEMKVLNEKSRTDINQGGVGITYIRDGGNNKQYLILDLSIAAMGVYYREVPTVDENKKFDYQYDKEDRKKIVGFECYKVTCTITDLETDETQEIIVYVSDDFLPDFKSMEFGELKGFPLYSKMRVKGDSYDFFQITEVTEINPSKKIKPVNFLLPSTAVPFSEMPEELKAMFGMSEGDED